MITRLGVIGDLCVFAAKESVVKCQQKVMTPLMVRVFTAVNARRQYLFQCTDSQCIIITLRSARIAKSNSRFPQ